MIRQSRAEANQSPFVSNHLSMERGEKTEHRGNRPEVTVGTRVGT
jgi:hypothetical protein